MFALGFLTDGGISMIGLISMDVVPTQMSGSAHGLACAMAQGAARAAIYTACMKVLRAIHCSTLSITLLCP